MLNSEQKKAVEILDKPVIVIAGPGTGKTAMICEKINYLFEKGAIEDEILALTFTQKAAEEMSNRVESISGKLFTAKTFHSFALEIIENYQKEFVELDLNYRLIEEFDSYLFFLENLEKFNLKSVQIKNNNYSVASDLQSAILKLKEFGIKLETIDKLSFQNDLIRCDIKLAYEKYEQYKEKNNLIDFSDILIYLHDLLSNNLKIRDEITNKYKYILVDEFQDTNKVQLDILKLIAKENITIVGDPKQSIYSFRGVFAENFSDFKLHFKNYSLIYLNQNYRASKKVLENINNFILKMSLKEELLEGNISLDGEVNVIEAAYEESQVKYIADKINLIKKTNPKATIGILSRRRHELREVSFKLKQLGVKHNSLQVLSFFNQEIIKELVILLKIINSPYDSNNEFFTYLQKFDLRFETIKAISRKASQKEKSIFKVLEEENLCEYLDEVTLLKRLKEDFDYFLEYKKTNVSVDKLIYEIIVKFNYYQKAIAFENKENILLLNRFIGFAQSFSNKYKDTSITRFLQVCDTLKNSDILHDEDLNLDNGVNLMTIHQSKGKEYDYVFVLYLNDRKFPSMYSASRFPIVFDITREKFIEEEKRLFFVAASRAKIGLDLVYVKRFLENKFDSKPCEFLSSINITKKIYDEKITDVKLASLEKIKLELISKINSLLLSGQFEEAKKNIEIMKALFSKKDLSLFLNPEINKNVIEYRAKVQKESLENVKINPETQVYSVSQLKTYESCPRKYLYNYVYKIPTSSKSFFDFGKSVHSVLENLISMFETESKEVLKQKAVLMLHKHWISKGYDNAIIEKEYFEKGVNAINSFIDKEFELRKEKREVVALEKEFLIQVNGKKILGYIDRIDKVKDEDYEIIDYKTSNSMETVESLNENLQLYVYAIALKELYEKYPSKVGLWYLVHDKLMQVSIDLKNIDKVKEKIMELILGIENNKFTQTPSFFNCTYCDFSSICKFSVKK